MQHYVGSVSSGHASMNYRTPGQEELATKVGSARPTFRRICKGKNLIVRFLAPFEYSAAWFFFVFNNVAFFGFSIEAVAAKVLIITVVGVYGEFQQRKVDRAVRVPTLFAQIAQLHSLSEGKGLRAIKAAVEALTRENVSMQGIDLSCAVLDNADLSGARLAGADLSDADLTGANLSGTYLRIMKHLSIEQLLKACAASNKPPLLPPSFSGKEAPDCNFLLGLDARSEHP